MDRSRSALVWVLAFSLGLSVGRLLRRWLDRMRRGSFDELSGIVSHSSRLVAAWRAVETLQQDALFRDPFALPLAGPAAFQEALAASMAFGSGASAPPWWRTHRISNVAARVWWFDRHILAALQPPQPAAVAPAREVGGQAGAAVELPIVEKGGFATGPAAATVRNVVVLGSGMDTRPWRLEGLPPGVRWWEVDRRDVLEAKQRVLRQLGVQLSREDAPGVAGGAGHPLRVDTWTALEVDLGNPGWTQQLQAAGFDPTLPTVWVAEGLLMYLQPAESDAALREMAEVSAPDSVAVLHNVTEALLESLRRGEQAYNPPWQPELMSTWASGFPADPTEVLARAGWQLEQAVSRAQIAAEICGAEAEAKCDFETRVGTGRDLFAVFVVARR